MITVERLCKRFGGLVAVNDVSLTIQSGKITGLIGPNGAGKSTLFNLIAGRYQPTSGRVLLDGADITGMPPHELFARGLLRTFQIAHEFSTLTVRENLMVVAPRHPGERLFNVWLRPGWCDSSTMKFGKKPMKFSSSSSLTTLLTFRRVTFQAARKSFSNWAAR